MAAKDIEKLREKFDKDPNSKLFLPLAEEYRKEGMLEEAIDVLQQGLEKHVSYTSARVLLGKTYLEKGMMDEARKEFESVIKIVPDNLFAHKKLAEVYRDTGETDLAIKAFKAILKLNPMDEESLSSLRNIEAALSPAPVPVAEEAKKADSSYGEIRMPGAAVSDAEEPVDMQGGQEIHIAAPDIQVEHSEDELNAFKDSLFGDKSDLGDELEVDNEINVETNAETEEETEEAGVVFISDDKSTAAEDLSFEDVGEAIAEELMPAVSEPFSAAEKAEETIEFAEEPFEIAEEPVAAAFETATEAPEKYVADLSDADRFVNEGKFAEAMGVYRRFLANDPNDKRVLQRVEELRALLKLMGKDKEMLIDKLNAFLEGIYKGRDGFLGHS
ncbi:MAG: tetratricopeptide repeat protein [Nitrospirae bacterium]|nr:tetratricopeptide repeat protein [Nitrospirota bacterium]